LYMTFSEVDAKLSVVMWRNNVPISSIKYKLEGG